MKKLLHSRPQCLAGRNRKLSLGPAPDCPARWRDRGGWLPVRVVGLAVGLAGAVLLTWSAVLLSPVHDA